MFKRVGSDFNLRSMEEKRALARQRAEEFGHGDLIRQHEEAHAIRTARAQPRVCERCGQRVPGAKYSYGVPPKPKVPGKPGYFVPTGGTTVVREPVYIPGPPGVDPFPVGVVEHVVPAGYSVRGTLDTPATAGTAWAPGRSCNDHGCDACREIATSAYHARERRNALQAELRQAQVARSRMSWYQAKPSLSPIETRLVIAEREYERLAEQVREHDRRQRAAPPSSAGLPATAGAKPAWSGVEAKNAESHAAALAEMRSRLAVHRDGR